MPLLLNDALALCCRSGVRIKTRKRNIVVPHDPQVRRQQPGCTQQTLRCRP